MLLFLAVAINRRFINQRRQPGAVCVRFMLRHCYTSSTVSDYSVESVLAQREQLFEHGRREFRQPAFASADDAGG